MTKTTDPAYPVREIKFRAWHNRDKIMATVGTLYWNGQVRVSYKKGPERPGYFFGGNSVGADWAKEDCTLMQFTGLRDKNGVEIYEGDHNGWAVVVFHGGGFWLDVVGSNETFPLWEQAASVHIVGNIYEHKHLMAHPELIEQLNREEGK